MKCKNNDQNIRSFIAILIVAIAILCNAEEQSSLPFKEIWHYDSNESIDDLLNTDEVLFVAGDHSLRVLNTNTGKLLLDEIMPDHAYGAPRFAKGSNKVYLMTGEKKLLAYDLKTLKQEWSIQLGVSGEFLAASHNVIIIQRDWGLIEAINSDTQKEMWQFNLKKMYYTWIENPRIMPSLYQCMNRGLLILRFDHPFSEYLDEGVESILEKNYLLRNKENTEIKLNLEKYHAERTGKWYDVILRKINGRWLVIKITQTGVS